MNNDTINHARLQFTTGQVRRRKDTLPYPSRNESSINLAGRTLAPSHTNPWNSWFGSTLCHKKTITNTVFVIPHNIIIKKLLSIQHNTMQTHYHNAKITLSRNNNQSSRKAKSSSMPIPETLIWYHHAYQQQPACRSRSIHCWWCDGHLLEPLARWEPSLDDKLWELAAPPPRGPSYRALRRPCSEPAPRWSEPAPRSVEPTEKKKKKSAPSAGLPAAESTRQGTAKPSRESAALSFRRWGTASRNTGAAIFRARTESTRSSEISTSERVERLSLLWFRMETFLGVWEDEGF